MSEAALVIPCRAKLNLGLAVTGVRADGYHELDTIMQAVSHHDLLLISPACASSLEVYGADLGDPGGNLVLRAQQELEREVGRRLPAAFILHKRIPTGAGLGGGSSDAAACLRGLSRLHRLDLDLAPVALRVGADVPFFLRGGTARVTGIGERVVGLPEPPGRWFQVAWPGFGISTRAAFQAWDRLGGEGANQLTRAAVAVEPRLGEFLERLGPGWQMTGSGSACFRGLAGPGDARPLDCWHQVVWAVPAWA